MTNNKWLIWGVICAIAFLVFYPQSRSQAINPSSYALSQKAAFNQPSFYPIEQEINPQLYQAVGDWVGRLILPAVEEMEVNIGKDWVWFEVYHAPENAENLQGERVRLEWQETPEIRAYLNAVTTKVKLSQNIKNSSDNSIIYPTRLDNNLPVGPLQSLAGARPNDDVIVRLEGVKRAGNTLKVADDPIQVTGRFYGLVKILGRDGERLTVRHYNRDSGEFDGETEVVRFPTQPPDRTGVRFATPEALEDLSAGEQGWYIYGAQDRQGRFTIQAIAPRLLLQLQPQQVVLGRDSLPDLWENTRDRAGTVTTTLIDPGAETKEKATQDWQAGDRALVLHLFGGIGGELGDGNSVFATTTGHFSFGVGTVVRDAFTDELRWDIVYQQVYAHNTNGIIAGNAHWSNYMGDLQRGWLGMRPVVDVLVKLEAITQPYNFNSVILSPLQALSQQLDIMMARYRTGDGTGSATVTPAVSCVQDSSQALYIAIEQVKQQVATQPGIQAWLQEHSDHPQTQRFQVLQQLGEELERNLTPLGVVRPDWRQNAEKLAGVGDRFVRDNRLLAIVLSWRTMMPRRGQDTLASLFLDYNAKLWALQSFQVRGETGLISPVAPTVLFGKMPVLSTLLGRAVMGLTIIPNRSGWLILGVIALLYGAIAIPSGLTTGFLEWHWDFNWLKLIVTFWLPAFTEEWFFRGLLLPSPLENAAWWVWLFWGSLSTILFIFYHPFNARYFYPQGHPTFYDPSFLTLTTLLGIACAIAYGLTISLWSAIILHWLTVIIWLFALGGQRKLK